MAVANVRIGAVFAIGAAIAGWRLASSPGMEATSSLEWHRWLGTIAAVAVFGAALATAGAARSIAVCDVGLPDRAVLGGGARRCHRSSRGLLVWGADFLRPVNKEACVKQTTMRRRGIGAGSCSAWPGSAPARCGPWRAACSRACRSNRPRAAPWVTARAWAASASSRSATAISASTSRRTPMSPRRCAPRSRRSRRLPNSRRSCLHTGDLTHLSKPSEFDTLQQVLAELSLPVFYVPGEHDVLEDDGKSYLQRFGKGTQGAGWHSFDQGGVHFIGLVNVVNLKAGGLGTLGNEQLEWLEKDVKRLKSSTPIVVFAHIPLWSVYPEWGWGTDDSARALSYLKRFGSVSVLNGHIHQVMQKVEGHVSFHTAMSTAFPQPAPGSAPSPGPMKVEADRLKKVLGLSRMSFHDINHPIAITDVAARRGQTDRRRRSEAGRGGQLQLCAGDGGGGGRLDGHMDQPR